MKSLHRCTLPIFAAALSMLAFTGFAQTALTAAAAPAAAPYKVLSVTQELNTGSTDYIGADSVGRRVYVPSGPTIHVFDLDTFKSVGSVQNAAGHGVAIDSEYHHGFVSGNPSVMFDTQTFATIKTNPARGADGILFDAFNHRVYILSHGAPNLQVFDTKDGSPVGTVDALGKDGSNAATEQGVTDGNGTLYFDVEDQGCVAVVDAKTLKVTGEYDLGPSGAGDAGLAIDAKNHILFAMCRGAGGRGAPAGGAAGSGPTCVILSATDGKIITTLPLAGSSDGAIFNPNTMEAFASQGTGNGTVTIIKENSPTDFVVEQNLTTKSGAKCITLDAKANHIVVFTTERLPTPVPAAASASASAAPAMASASAAPAAASTSAAPMAAAASASASGGRRGGPGGGRGSGGPANLDVIFIGRDSAK